MYGDIVNVRNVRWRIEAKHGDGGELPVPASRSALIRDDTLADQLDLARSRIRELEAREAALASRSTGSGMTWTARRAAVAGILSLADPVRRFPGRRTGSPAAARLARCSGAMPGWAASPGSGCRGRSSAWRRMAGARIRSPSSSSAPAGSAMRSISRRWRAGCGRPSGRRASSCCTSIRRRREVLGHNPHVLGVLVPEEPARSGFLDLAHALDVFDLIADVRYVVSYATPPLSRIPAEFLRLAHGRAAPWQRYVRLDWPHRNNDLAKQAVRAGFGKLDLAGHTGNLAVSGRQGPEFFPRPGTMYLAPVPRPAADPLAPVLGRPTSPSTMARRGPWRAPPACRPRTCRSRLWAGDRRGACRRKAMPWSSSAMRRRRWCRGSTSTCAARPGWSRPRGC